MADIITIGSLEKILVQGEIMKEIFLQIVFLRTFGDKLSIQLSDTINKCETIELSVQNLSKLSLYNVIKIEEYTLKLFEDSTKNNGQIYNFGKIRITGANRHITEMIGKPLSIHKNMCVNADGKKQLTTQQELFIYYKRDLAKLRLQKTTILNKKQPFAKMLEEGENEKAQIIRQIDQLKEKLDELNKKLISKSQKIDEINEKIVFHSKAKH